SYARYLSRLPVMLSVAATPPPAKSLIFPRLWVPGTTLFPHPVSRPHCPSTTDGSTPSAFPALAAASPYRALKSSGVVDFLKGLNSTGSSVAIILSTCSSDRSAARSNCHQGQVQRASLGRQC